MNIQSYLAAAIAIEGIISWGKTVIIDKQIQWPVIISLACSFLLVFDLQLNVLGAAGLEESYPMVGMAITAIALSRGTNYFYEFYSRLSDWKAGE